MMISEKGLPLVGAQDEDSRSATWNHDDQLEQLGATLAQRIARSPEGKERTRLQAISAGLPAALARLETA